MAVLRVRKFRDITELELFLQGAVIGKQVGEYIPNIVGKTLVFTQPTNTTFTFVAGTDVVKTDSKGLSRKEVKAQLEAGVAGLTVKFLEGRLVLIQTSPTAGQGVNINGGSARDEIGLAENATTTGTVYNDPAGAAPKVVTIYSGNDTNHILVTSE